MASSLRLGFFGRAPAGGAAGHLVLAVHVLRLDAHLVVSTLVPHRLDDVQADEGLGLDALLDLLARLLGGEVCGFLETTREG